MSSTKAKKAFSKSWHLKVLHCFFSFAVLLLLALYPISAMGAFSLWLVVLLSSYLIYGYVSQLLLVRRHAYLSLLVQEQSVWKQRLWQSLWAQLGVGIVAVFLALGMLIALAKLTPAEWAVLTLSVVSFHLIQFALQPWVKRHIQTHHQTNVALRMSHLLNLVLLVVALLALHFWITEVPQTSHLAFSDVVYQAYVSEQESAQLQLSGWVLGINAALYESFWYLVQWMTGTLPWWLTLIFWLLIMCALAVQVSLIWLVLLGIYSRLAVGLGKSPKLSPASRARYMVWAVVVGIGSLGWYVVNSEFSAMPSWAPLQEESSLSTEHEARSDPCHESNLSALRADFVRRNRHLRTVHEQQVIEQLHTHIDEVLEHAYGSTGQMTGTDEAINHFLDWNFSLLGQYTQLAYLMRSSFSKVQFEQLMAEKIDDFFSASLEQPLKRAEAQLNHGLVDALQQGASAYQTDVTVSSTQHTPWCVTLPPVDLNLSALFHKSGVGAGVAPGLLVMSRALTPGAAVAARTGTRRMIAGIFARFSARAGSSATAATAGSVCGPICMLVLGGATWVGTDLIINYGDERLNRADMFVTLQEDIAAHKEALADTLKVEAEVIVSALFSDLERMQDERFNLSRELRQ